MSEYFARLNSLGANVKVELDLSNHATKADWKNTKGVDTLSFAKKTDLANLKSNADKLDIDELKIVPSNLNNLKSKVDKLDIGKSETTPVDLSKLSNVVKNDVVKKMYIILRSKILKTKYLTLLTQQLILALMLK